MNTTHTKALFPILILAIAAVTLASEPPTLTSSFFGTASVDGNDVPAGTVVSASIGGVELDATSFFSSPEVFSFRLDVPGDLPATPGDEGGVLASRQQMGDSLRARIAP